MLSAACPFVGRGCISAGSPFLRYLSFCELILSLFLFLTPESFDLTESRESSDKERSFSLDGEAYREKFLATWTKKGRGIAPPSHAIKALCFDVFLFPRVFGEYPLPAFDFGSDDLTIGVLAVFPLVVIPQGPRDVEGSESPTFDYDFARGPRFVPHLGDTGMGQFNFRPLARVVGEDGVLSHLVAMASQRRSFVWS